ncbi:DUF6088 family protein [Sediminibacterium ginsengisoli]|uniref:Transcriptional regulator, AbiEi antitoxin, Type IV TA system n=1 Tax=Sediminibacterium ginsengisoli TaxID=413434 RepID=A0A1T4NZE4_9BACT|nr:DUF6088 family protein [Sediminibacterium ginsengisoli]SJZ84472.1 hypothetical protein SAMN04488132_10562 [Sediminibacterium ginsengisoli]
MYNKSSLHNRLEQAIAILPDESLFSPFDFWNLGRSTAILMALSRLTAKNLVLRIAKGLYIKTKQGATITQDINSVERLAYAIADKEGVQIRPTGDYALLKLGISENIPRTIVFLTNGTRRRIKTGSFTLIFKTTTKKKLIPENETVFLTIQAINILGTSILNQATIEILASRLIDVSPSSIQEFAHQVPQPTKRILVKIAAQLEHLQSIPIKALES